MSPLRERMLEELCRHNYAPRTGETYLAQIAKLARHFGTSPDQLSREQVQEYQDLLTSQRVSWLPQAVAAMQFLYNKVLERDWKITHSYRPKARRASVVLTPQEVSRLLAAAEPDRVGFGFAEAAVLCLAHREGRWWVAWMVTPFPEVR